MNELKELTKAEEQIMHILWDLQGGFVKDVIDQLEEPKPAYNTISTIIRILETKGFLGHESFGKSHRYIPLVTKQDYKKLITKKILHGYFDNSPKSILSFFLEENSIDVQELNEIMTMLEKHK